MSAVSTQSPWVIKERLSFQAKQSGLLTRTFSWWILVVESRYELRQMGNATCTRLSHLQVGTVMHRKKYHRPTQSTSLPSSYTPNSIVPPNIPHPSTHLSILLTGTLVVKSALGWLTVQMRVSVEYNRRQTVGHTILIICCVYGIARKIKHNIN